MSTTERQTMQQPPAIAFQITIGGRGSSGYTVRAHAAGRAVEAPLGLTHLPDDTAELGRVLGAALFPPPIRQLLLDVAHGAEGAGARVQIQLHIGPPELAGLPWEWATLGSSTLWQPAIRDDYTLVRVLRRVEPLPTLTVRGPLRLLIACADDGGAALAALGHDLAEPVRAGALVVDLLRNASADDLRVALGEEPCHILHILAPLLPERPPRPPQLAMGRGLPAAELAEILAEQPGLRFLTLAADGGEADSWAYASSLHERTAVAVAAIGGLDATQSATFAAACYAGLAAGTPLDLAVTDGRTAVAAGDGRWGLPQLCLAVGGEQLFELRPAEPARSRPAADTITVGRPLRPEQTRRSHRASAPQSAAGLFAVQTTSVGAPARRAGPPPSRLPAIAPRLIVLVVAAIVLTLMVLPLLRLPGTAAEPPAPTPATQSINVPTLISVGPAQAAAGQPLIADPPATAPVGNPLSVPVPQRYSTYLVATGDTLVSLAGRSGSTAEAIAAYNYLSPGAPLRPGRPLVLPLYSQGDALPIAPVIARGNPERPMVALTFDIEIDEASLYAILDVLRPRQIKATFFLTGRWASSYPDAAKAILRDGHEIGNHSLTHPSFSAIGAEGAQRELAETEQILRTILGVSSRPYFRFPYGDEPAGMVEQIARQGYVAYHWSADDYAIPGWLAKAAANPAEAYGGILLMHGRQSTAASLPDWLDQLRAAGLQPTSLGEVLR